MDINKRMFNTMKQKKITQEELANALNTSQSVVAGWKNRGTVPTMEYLPTICEVLGVSWEYLITGTESKEYFSPEEKKLIEQFRTLPIESLKEIQKFIEYQIYKNKGE